MDFGTNNLPKEAIKEGAFWENKGWIKSIDPYGWFQWY